MEKEINFVGFTFLGNVDFFQHTYNTEIEAVKAAEDAYINGDVDTLGVDENGELCKVVDILAVSEIDKESVLCNALYNAIDYTNETYHDFESGIDDGDVIFNPEILNIVVPIMNDNCEFGGITQKGERIYSYDIINRKKI